jgi:hypothetical protein
MLVCYRATECWPCSCATCLLVFAFGLGLDRTKGPTQPRHFAIFLHLLPSHLSSCRVRFGVHGPLRLSVQHLRRDQPLGESKRHGLCEKLGKSFSKRSTSGSVGSSFLSEIQMLSIDLEEVRV